MGIINSLRDKINKKNNQTKQEQYNTIERQDGTEINIYGQQTRFGMKHGNGDLTKVVTARLTIAKPSDTIMITDARPICFEIPRDMDENKIFSEEFMQYLENNGYFDNLSNDEYNMLGRINIQDNFLNITSFSNAVFKEAVKLNSEIKIQKDMIADVRRKEAEDRKQRESIERQEEEKRRVQSKEEMKSHIHFIQDTMNSYQTVDQNTGRQIVLSNVRKLGKDPESNYIYIGNMQQLDDIAYRMDDNLGYNVVFSTAYKLDQIAMSQNPELINKISLLLSVQNELDENKREYLGQLTKEGEITRELEKISPILQNKVKELQIQYENERQGNDEYTL